MSLDWRDQTEQANKIIFKPLSVYFIGTRFKITCEASFPHQCLVFTLHNTTRIENSFCSFWERFQSLKVHRWKSKYLTRQQIGITEIFELLTITSRPNCLYKHLPFLFFLKGEFTFFSPSFHRKIDNTHDYQRNYKQPRRLFSCFFFPFNQKQTSDLKRINKT